MNMTRRLPFILGLAPLAAAAILTVHAAIAQTPGQTPGVAPGQTPGAAPGQTPGQTPGVAPGPAGAGAPAVHAVPQTQPALIPGKAVEPDVGNSWFKKTQLDMGTHFQENHITGEFEFTNPTGADQKVTNVLPSCGCTNTWFEVDGKTIPVTKPFEGEVVIPAGKPCKLKVQMDLKGFVGRKEGDIRIQTTDPNLSFASLKIFAEVKVFFEVSPETVSLGELHYSDVREFVVNVSSPHAKDWNIVRHEGTPPKMSFTTEKITENGRVRYLIKGKYGPGIEEGTGGGTISFYTDVENKKFDVKVSGFVVGPLRVTPSTFLAFGHVPQGTSKELKVEFMCQDPQHQLKIESVEFTNLQNTKPSDFSYQVTDVEAGKKVMVAVSIKETAPMGKASGQIKITTSHPLARLREFRFNAFVR